MFGYYIMNGLEITAITLILINVIFALGAILLVFGIRTYKREFKLVFQVDKLATEQNNHLVAILHNINKHEEIWSVNESSLKFYYKKERISGVKFEKHPSIKGAYRMTFANQISFTREELNLVTGYLKDFSVSANGGITKTNMIHLAEKQIKRKRKPVSSESVEAAKLRKSLFLDYKNSDKQFRFDYANLIDFKKGTHVHVNESKSTPTSLRYQMIIPDDYLATIDLVPEEVKLYYTFEGSLYEMDTVFIGRTGDFFEWDLINLEPNTAYVGLSLSSKHNPLIRPSKAFYGITKDEDGHISNLDGAQIAQANDKRTEHPMWTEDVAIEAIGKELAMLQYKIIAKKHYELYEENAFLIVNEAEKVFDKFPWLKTGKKALSRVTA